jgi:hypothetical protein
MTNLTFDDLQSESVELLPSRETLSYSNWADISATNVALASNAGSLLAWAAASANQAVLVSQTNS